LILGVSNNDANLFSNSDDSNNQGISGKINAKQRLFSKKWIVDAFTIINFQKTEPSKGSTPLNLIEIGIWVRQQLKSKFTNFWFKL
jgi:hypothetical protein